MSVSCPSCGHGGIPVQGYRKADNGRDALRPAQLPASISADKRICHFVRKSNPPLRESRIQELKCSQWKIRDSRAPEPGQLVSGKRLLLDRSTRAKKFVRQGRQGTSATKPPCYLFAFPEEGLSLLQIENHGGKSTAESCLLEGIFLG